jgi:hypothetical protein
MSLIDARALGERLYAHHRRMGSTVMDAVRAEIQGQFHYGSIHRRRELVRRVINYGPECEFITRHRWLTDGLRAQGVTLDGAVAMFTQAYARAKEDRYGAARLLPGFITHGWISGRKLLDFLLLLRFLRRFAPEAYTSLIAHPHVNVGFCRVCGHYGDDCTGLRAEVC